MSMSTRSKTVKTRTAKRLIPADDNETKKSLDGRLGRKRRHDDGHENSINPLLNDLVLENLFQYVPRIDLLSCRLVCKTWNILSLPFVRYELCVDIVGTGSPSGQTRGIVNFMKLIHSNTLGIPFEKFSLGSFDTTKGAGQQFIQICGPTAKQIILTTEHYSRNHVIQNISKMLRSTQNFESFTMPRDMGSKGGKFVKLFDNTEPKPTFPFLKFLDVSLESSTKRRKICPTFYEELLEAAPNISTLVLDTHLNVLNTPLEVLESIKQLGRAKFIENLIITRLTDETLELLQSMSTEMNLKQLELSGSGMYSLLLGFELTKIFQNTLIALRLNCTHGPPETPNPPVNTLVDQLPKLKFLQVTFDWAVSLECESLNSTFPALEKMDINFDTSNIENYQICLYQTNNILISDEPCSIPTLKSSIIRCTPIILEKLERIITIFPTLKTLKCKVTVEDGAEVIRNIWSRMTQLEGLHLYGEVAEGVNIDSLLTGISGQEIASKNMQIKGFFESLESLEIENRREKLAMQKNKCVITRNFRLPSIGNLTNLRSLKLKLSEKTCDEMTDMYLTDVTGYFALYSLKNLQHLNVSNCEITKSCAEILVKDKNLMTWKFKSTDFVDIIPRSWSRHKITENLREGKFPLLNV